MVETPLSNNAGLIGIAIVSSPIHINRTIHCLEDSIRLPLGTFFYQVPLLLGVVSAVCTSVNLQKVSERNLLFYDMTWPSSFQFYRHMRSLGKC